MKRPPTPTDYRAETWAENGKARHGVRKGLYGSGHLAETAGGRVRTWPTREAAEAAAAAMNEQAERTLRETALVEQNQPSRAEPTQPHLSPLPSHEDYSTQRQLQL